MNIYQELSAWRKKEILKKMFCKKYFILSGGVSLLHYGLNNVPIYMVVTSFALHIDFCQNFRFCFSK